MEYRKQCEICGCEYIAKSAKGRFCSQKCRQTAGRRGLYKRKNTKSQKITDEQLIEACKTMTLYEIAEKYDMHPQSLPRRFYPLGCKPVGYRDVPAGTWIRVLNEKIKKGEIRPSGEKRSIYGECWHYVARHDDLTRRNQPGFYYLESTTSRKKPRRIRLQCKECGEIIERASATVRQKNCECEYCKNEKKLKEARLRLIWTLVNLENAKAPKVCQWCGQEFFSEYALKAYCSDGCKKKAKRNRRRERGWRPNTPKIRANHYSSRCRKYGSYYEPGISRIKVVARDGGICRICGKECDENDKRWGSFGPDYPTVDHIIPLSKGGTHTWENVQCACGMCNSNKRDLITA